MIELQAKFDCVGRFKPSLSEEKESTHAHFIIGKPGDNISGGLYLPKDMPFPEEGILIKVRRTQE
jgi:hypothetical protein